MPQMGVTKEQMNAPEPVPAGWYDLKITGIEVKAAKNKDSFNYNVAVQVVNTNNPDWDYKKKLTARLNTKMGSRFADLIHAAGFEDEGVISENGSWEFAKDDPENPEKAQYKGPLLGKVVKAEVVTRTYQGNEFNDIKQFACTVPDCKIKNPKIRHSTDWIGKNK